MVYQVRYTLLAAREVRDAYNGYHEQAGERVASRFMDEIARGEGPLCHNPHLYQRIEGEVRHLVLRRYPYALVYAIFSDVVQVLGCFHSRREPMTLSDWLKRGDSGALPDADLHGPSRAA